MAETFLALLAAHLLADFPLQPDWMIQRKRNRAVLALHAAIVVAAPGAALGAWTPALLAILLASHVIMDAIKTYWLKDTLRTFAIDQGVHLMVIAVLALAYPQTFEQGWWNLLPAWLTAYPVGLYLLSGVIASLQVGAIVIRKATIGFTRQIADEIQGSRARRLLHRLPRAGSGDAADPDGPTRGCRLPHHRQVDPSLRRCEGVQSAQADRIHHHRRLHELWVGAAGRGADQISVQHWLPAPAHP
jgi:Protein of unknown function (DUF3307)